MQNQKKIILNDETDYGECFACGPKNPYGLKLKFIEEKNTVKTTFNCTKEYQGFPGYTHGGIITTIIDEVMSRVSVLEGKWASTAKLDLRFKKLIPINENILAQAKKIRILGKFIQIEGKIYLSDGTIAAEGKGMFAILNENSLKEMSKDYPSLSKNWMY